MRLRLFGVVLRGLFFDEVFYTCEFFVSLQLVGFGRRGECDALAVSLDSLEQFAHAWEGAHARHVLALVEFAAVLLKLFAELFEFFFREEDGHQLVAALAYLVAHALIRNLLSEMRERLLPGARVQVNGVNERPVNVENHSLDQVHSSDPQIEFRHARRHTLYQRRGRVPTARRRRASVRLG